MKNKKGFTLIELVAVIVILAILALIAIPIVISIINDSRENAHKRSIETYGRSVENAIAQWQAQHGRELPTENDIDFSQIKTSGEKVKCEGISGIDSDNGIELTNCYAVDSKGNQKSKDKYNYKNGEVNKVDEDTSDNIGQDNENDYYVGKQITVAGDDYYIISKDNNKDYVTALKAEPITVSEWENNDYGKKYIQEEHYVNGYISVEYYATSTCGYYYDPWGTRGKFSLESCNNDYNFSDIRQVANSWANIKFTNNELKQVEGYKARLLNQKELSNIAWPNCTSFSHCLKEDSTPNWIYNSKYSYWTMVGLSTNDDYEYVLVVKESGGSGSKTVNVQMAYDPPIIRPVFINQQFKIKGSKIKFDSFLFECKVVIKLLKKIHKKVLIFI